MNAFKKTGGFTLVELIIVIAILAILSSVAVAGYSSYIKKANDSAVNTFLNEIKTQAVLANAQAGGIGEIIVVVKGENVEVYIQQGANGFAKDFDKDIAYSGCATYTTNTAYKTFTVKAPSALAASSYKLGATLTAGATEWTAAASATTAPAAAGGTT
jgi:prepilin-type N-terminal cleavage/methylation domain-containing protein